MILRSGKTEGVPYSLSRWTDVPDAKWEWFRGVMVEGKMEAFDPGSGVPGWWSLAEEDTLGLVFWTKNPSNLIKDQALLGSRPVKVHVTATGWHEVEKGAPSLQEAAVLLGETVKAFGAENVRWRFSPVPILEFNDLLVRFFHLAEAASNAGLKSVYLSFLQPNDRVPETRPWNRRLGLLNHMALTVGSKFGLDLLLCNEDRLIERWSEVRDWFGDPITTPPPANLKWGVCADPSDFPSHAVSTEGCGCVLMADPFTINESCTMGCTYCYASDKTLAVKKRNTTRSLPVIR